MANSSDGVGGSTGRGSGRQKVGAIELMKGKLRRF